MSRRTPLTQCAAGFDDVGQPVNLGEDARKLRSVSDTQRGIDQRQVIFLTCERLYRDHIDMFVRHKRSHISHQAGPVIGADLNLYRVCGFRFVRPLHIDQSVVLTAPDDIGNVGAVGSVDGDAAATRYIACNRVAGHRIAALAEAGKQALHPLHAEAVIDRALNVTWRAIGQCPPGVERVFLFLLFAFFVEDALGQ